MKTMFRGASRFATPLKLSAVAVAAILAACSSSDSPPPELSATIRTTSYGVPHVVADNFKSAGFGYGYVFAQQNICLYAEELVTLRGEHAQYFGKSILL